MQKYVRKHDHKLFLFGYQSIGGSEYSILNGLNNSDESEVANTSIRLQNKPGSNFNQRSVKQLFIDGDGTYHSGPVDLDAGDICLVSGVFYTEYDRETVESVDDMISMFDHVRNVSEQIGHFSVLRGLKEQGVALPTDLIVNLDSEMEDES